MLDFCDCYFIYLFLMKDQSVNNTDLFLQASLILFIKGGNNSDNDCKNEN